MSLRSIVGNRPQSKSWIPFRTVGCFALILWICPAWSSAQSALTGEPAVLEELKAMRQSLEQVEKGQRALLALLAIQVNDQRMASLETQRQRLAAEEQELDKKARQAAEEARNVDGGALAVLLPNGGDQQSVIQAEIRKRQDDADRRLGEVRRSLDTIDRQIAALQEQITTMEKQLTEALK